jgi:pentapeptide MXKDX repeat protein
MTQAKRGRDAGAACNCAATASRSQPMLLANGGMLSDITIKFKTHMTHHSTAGEWGLILRAAVHHDLNVSVPRRLVAKVEHRLRPGKPLETLCNFRAGSTSHLRDRSVSDANSTRNRGRIMRKTICKLMAMCFLAVSLAAFAQSGDNMKQDSMKHDDMKQDQMNNGQMKKDEMKKDKKSKQTKKDKMKKDDMKKDDNMKQDDSMKH